MSSSAKSLISVLLAMLLAACASTPPRILPNAQSPWVATRVQYHLTMAKTNMLLVLEYRAHSMLLLGVNPAGITQFVLQRDALADKLVITKFADLDFSPIELLNGLLLANYDKAYLSDIYSKDWQLRQLQGHRCLEYKGVERMCVFQPKNHILQIETKGQSWLLHALSKEPIKP